LRRNDFIFGAVFKNSDAESHFGVKSPSVILFKKFDEKKNIFSGEAFSELHLFVDAHSVPLIDEIGPQNYQMYMSKGLPMGFLFVDLTVAGQMEENVEKLRSIAEQTKDRMSWIYIDWSKYSKHSERLGLSGTVVPALSIDELSTGKHFAFDESKPLSEKAVSDWVKEYLDGKLQPTIRSEEIPADNSGPVKVVVAKSYDDIVMDPTKDVLVEFYAPWCGHCKALAPIYEEVGKHYQKNSGVVIAKIDATANDVNPKLGIRGFPTVKFFPAGAENKNSPIDYDGDRTFEAFTSFIQQHGQSKTATKDEL